MSLKEAITKVRSLRNKRGELLPAIEILETALERIDPGEETKVASEGFLLLGTLYRDVGDWSAARSSYRKVLGAARSREDFRQEIEARRQLTFLDLQESGPFDKVKAKAEELVACLMDLEEGQDKSEIAADVRALLGNVYARRNDLSKALDSYELGLEYAREVNYRDREITLLADIGDVYLQQEDLAKAESYLNRALELAQGTNAHAVVSLLIRLGRLSYSRSRYQRAERYCRQALNISKRQGWKLHQAEALEGLKYIYDQRGENQTAAALLEEAQRVRREIRGNG